MNLRKDLQGHILLTSTVKWMRMTKGKWHHSCRRSTIRTSSKTTFTVEVASKEQSTAMQEVKDINGISVKVGVNTALNVNKGVLYIYGYNMVDFEAFKAGLAEQYGLSSVVEAAWIKPRRGNNAKPVWLTFPIGLPQHLNIPGEMMMTKVLEYKRRQLMCKRCLIYGHGKNQCEKEYRCGKCETNRHMKQECSGAEVKCFHCKEGHEAGSGWCMKYRYQQEIIAMQVRERVSMNQARTILDRWNPNFRNVTYVDIISNEARNTIGISSGSILTDGETDKSEQPLTGRSEKGELNGSEVAVLCRSPNSGQWGIVHSGSGSFSGDAVNGE